MKTRTIIAILALALGAGACSSETITHDASKLPEKARNVISRNFTSAISLVEEETTGLGQKEYEVTLTDGSEISFTSSGEWTSVDTPNNLSVPEGMVPTAIARFVAEKHAGANIVGIEREKKGFEVELSNGVDIVFDAAGNFVKYDK